jgi:hypothetical protein
MIRFLPAHSRRGENGARAQTIHKFPAAHFIVIIVWHDGLLRYFAVIVKLNVVAIPFTVAVAVNVPATEFAFRAEAVAIPLLVVTTGADEVKVPFEPFEPAVVVKFTVAPCTALPAASFTCT